MKQHSNSSTIRAQRRRLALGFALAPVAAVLLGSPLAHADTNWPSKPIEIIVPFGPGGTTDVLARLIAEGISRDLKQPVVVQNKPGAGANIGATEVARAAPDGYTLLMGTPGPLAINPYIYDNMAFDPAKDFAAVSYVADVPNVMLANPGTNIKNLDDLIKEAKARPGKLNWGSPGIGSTGHLQLELLKQMTGVDIVHVPYKGSAAVTNDLIAGHIDLAGDNVPTALANIRAGKVTALAIAGEEPLDVLPGVPAASSTAPGYRMPSWFVLVAPAGTPSAVTDKIASAVDSFVKQPETIEKFSALGAVAVGGPPETLAKHLASEQARFGKLLQQMETKK